MNKYIFGGIAIVVIIVLVFLTFRFNGSKKSDILNGTSPELQNLEGQVVGSQNLSSTDETTESINNLDNKKAMSATLQTNYGDIKIEFFENDSPKTVENFVKLANSKFYNGVKFHRVIKGFMIQVGDPLSKDNAKPALWGTGGPGYQFNDEINVASDLYKAGYKKGVVAMANSGPNTNGSQFFIMHVDYPLPPLYTIFGRVVSGQDVVDKIASVETGPGDRPIEYVVLKSVIVE